MSFKPPDFVRVRYDTLFLIGSKLTEKQRLMLAPYIGRSGFVRAVSGHQIKVFFPSLQKNAWFDDYVLEEYTA